MKIQAQVIAHSKNEFGDELVTFVVTFPRFILAELNTHRMFSRNSASSRAIPFNKMVESVTNNPFIPIAWQKDHKGMQGTEYLGSTNSKMMDGLWGKVAVRQMIEIAQSMYLDGKGITKQLANRLLEPFMWHTVIITTGKEGLENFFDLRCPQYDMSEVDEGATNYKFKSKKEVGKALYGGKTNDYTELQWLQLNKGQAEIHMMALAEAMYDSYNESVPELLKAGEWHIPYKKEIAQNLNENFMYERIIGIPNMALISSVMCARVSYTVAGHDLTEWTEKKYIDKAIELADAKPLHASPFEHSNKTMDNREHKLFAKREPPREDDFGSYIEYGWCRNFRGFIQLRHIIEINKK